MQVTNLAKRQRRQKRVRSKVTSIARPRLSVRRSNQHIYAQIIDIATGNTVAFATDKELTQKTVTKSERAKLVGDLIAQKALKAKIKTVVFDRGSYKYHGRVKALAEAAREGGLQF